MFEQIKPRKKVIKHDIMRQVKRLSNTRDQNQYKCKDGDAAFGAKLLINNISYTSLCNLIRRNKLTRYLSVPHKLLPAIDFSIIFFAPAEPSSVAALFIVVCCRFCNLQKSGGRAGFTGVWWGLRWWGGGMKVEGAGEGGVGGRFQDCGGILLLLLLLCGVVRELRTSLCTLPDFVELVVSLELQGQRQIFRLLLFLLSGRELRSLCEVCVASLILWRWLGL